MTGSKSIAIYPYIDSNPYQSLLCKALERRGYKVLRVSIINKRLPFRILSECRKVDVLHLHWCEGLYEARTWFALTIRTMFFFLILGILRCQGVRIVYTLHNLVPHDTKKPRFDVMVRKLIIRMAHRTIVHSRPALDAAVMAFGARSKFAVIPHGHYCDAYPNEVSRAQARSFLGLPGEPKVALYFGSLHEKYKCAGTLLKTAKELRRRGILLLVAGETSKLEDTDRKLLREAAARGEVILHEGFIPDSEVQFFMKSADCLVVPYLDSLTSGVAALGLSFRLPIVGTNAVAFRELIDLRLCLPCDPTDPSSVAGTIEAICAWPRREFERRCNDFLVGCSWDEIAERQLAICNYATSGNTPLGDPKVVHLEDNAPNLARDRSS